MSKPYACPHCRLPGLLGQAARFDQDLNLLCRKCGGVVYAVTLEAEILVDAAVRSRSASHGSYDAWKETALSAGTKFEAAYRQAPAGSAIDTDEVGY